MTLKGTEYGFRRWVRTGEFIRHCRILGPISEEVLEKGLKMHVFLPLVHT